MIGVESPGNLPIVIKAPNQKISDLVINCNPNWTVQELKHHLSVVYPSKPHPQGQKLIYSGKLLLDSAIVNDVLKCYNGQQNNTIHLVCSFNKEPNVEYHTTNSSKESPSEPIHDTFTENDTGSSREFADASRQYPDVMNNRRFLMMTYLQYMAYYSQVNRPTEVREEQTFTDTRPETRPQNPPANENLVPEEDRLPNRDWLDWVYILSRLIVLSTLVYFYSSPVRCFLVTVMAFILYHLGMFRWRRAEVNAMNANQLNNNNGLTEGNVRERVDTAPVGDGVMQLRERFGWMKVIFNFLMSFVLSLNPDRDN